MASRHWVSVLRFNIARWFYLQGSKC